MNKIFKLQQQAKQKARTLTTKKKTPGFPRVTLTPEQIKHKHDAHQVEVRVGKAHNAGQLFCTECQKHIQWLSRQDYEFLLKEIK